MIQNYSKSLATSGARSLRVITPGRMMAGVAVVALAFAASPIQAKAAEGQGALYDTSTSSSGACPGMDWHVIVYPDKTVAGVVGWDKMQHLAKLSGTVGKDGKLDVKATEEGTAKTDTVSGTDDGSHIKVGISGTGTSCDNNALDVPRVTSNTSVGTKG
jgi:hypothetical protein